MVEEKMVVTLKSGLHARPATEFVKAASSFSSEITLEKGTKIVSAKSIMGILSMAIAKGDEIILSADGSDEVDAIATLKQVITQEE